MSKATKNKKKGASSNVPIEKVIEVIFPKRQTNFGGRECRAFTEFSPFSKDAVRNYLQGDGISAQRVSIGEEIYASSIEKEVLLILSGAVMLSFVAKAVNFDSDGINIDSVQIGGTVRLPGDYIGEHNYFSPPVRILSAERRSVLATAMTNEVQYLRIPVGCLYSVPDASDQVANASGASAIRFSLRQRLAANMAEKIRQDLSRRIRIFNVPSTMSNVILLLDLMCEFGIPKRCEADPLSKVWSISGQFPLLSQWAVELPAYNDQVISTLQSKLKNTYSKDRISALRGVHDRPKEHPNRILIYLHQFLPLEVSANLEMALLDSSFTPSDLLIKLLHCVRLGLVEPSRYILNSSEIPEEIIQYFEWNFLAWKKHLQETYMPTSKQKGAPQMTQSEYNRYRDLREEIKLEFPAGLLEGVPISGLHPALMVYQSGTLLDSTVKLY